MSEGRVCTGFAAEHVRDRPGETVGKLTGTNEQCHLAYRLPVRIRLVYGSFVSLENKLSTKLCLRGEEAVLALLECNLVMATECKASHTNQYQQALTQTSRHLQSLTVTR